ncbi:hypothetical protein [Salinivibrio kushneri]|uniref:hypothetical protein n=1 Tax=Salinivibrio kushneri TaxID=1908198 RepID=UPI0009897F2A|nr:hypothetical protein [Salinivibrio kushneri]OOE71082.1 hypothetical protein BZG19_03745 [Salinivibrio kushneri]
MSDKIKELKIKNYKKKIMIDYEFLNIYSVSHGDDDLDDMRFCRLAHNISEGEYKREGIYMDDDHCYIDNTEVWNMTLKLLSEKINHFNDEECVIFTAVYNGEFFRVKCDATEFIDNFSEIDCLREQPKIFNPSHTKLLSVMRLEYELERFFLSSSPQGSLDRR